MARRFRAALSLAVAAAIVVLSPGLEAPRLFAQVVVRAAPVALAPVVGAAPITAPAELSLQLSLSAPSLLAPSALSAAAAPSAPAAASAASMPELAQALAPHLEAAAKPDVTASGAAAAGRGIEDAITGQRSAGSGDVSAVAAVEGAGAPALGFSAAAAAPSEAPKTGVAAAASPAESKSVDSAISYRVHRAILKIVAGLTGAVFSMPAAGPSLTRALIASASNRRAVFSDYDDTLAAYNQVLPADMVSAVQAVKAAGKDFVVISDRSDEPRAYQLTVFESLASLPSETRAGMYVAANSGGRVYRYDETGNTPVRVFEAPALDDASKAKVAEAAEATKGRLKEIGAEQHVPSATNNNPSESWGAYGYALMLKVGSSNDQVRGAADILQSELAARGLNVEVNPRFAKDPANPPYINFSVVTKETSSAYIAKALKLQAKDILVIGDSMYTPHEAKNASWLTRLGEKVAGRALSVTGNRTDANMEKGAPGALTLSVGTTGDPRTPNLWVLAGKGPSVTREVLMSVASKTRARVEAALPSKESLKAAVSPASPVDGFASYVYDTGLAAARELAAKAGYRPDNIRFASAKLSPRAWGEDWTFSFVSPRESEFKDPRAYEVVVRRTMVSETQLDAISAKDLGEIQRWGMPSTFPASLFAETVKVSPMDVIAKSGDAARTLELQARWNEAGTKAQLAYVLRGDKGRELQAVDAATGEVSVPQPYAKLKETLITIGMIAATAGMFAAIYWAMSHAGVAASSVQVPDGWQGPIPSNVDLGVALGPASASISSALSVATAASLISAPADAPPPASAAGVPAAALPKSRYSAQIRVDASGARSVWIVVPPAPGAPVGAYELGSLTTLKAGTPLYHWGGADLNGTLSSGRLSEAELDARILRSSDPDGDLWGGGFYLSSRLADSADYGPRVMRTLSSRDALVVVCGAIAPSERLDVVLSLREAGVDVLQETAHPSWYNFVSVDALSGSFAEPTPEEAIDSVRGEAQVQAIEDIVLYDQRYPVDASRLPADAAAPLRALALGLAIDDAGRASLSGAMNKIVTMLLMMHAHGRSALRRTPLFDAYDGFVRQTVGRSLADILAS